MRAARRVFWNTLILFGAEAARLLIGLVLAVVVARALGSGALGAFTYLLALVGILSAIADLGFSSFYMREAQVNPTPALLGAFVTARTVTGLCSAAVLVVYAAVVRSEPTLAVLVLLGSLLLVLGIWPAAMSAVLRAQERMVYEGVAKIGSAVLLAAGGGLAVAAGGGIAAVVGAMVVASAVTALYYASLAWRFLPGPILLRQPRAAFTELLRGAWPFASLAVLGVIYFRIDSVMLFAMRGQEALGQYGAAYRAMEAALLLPLTLAGSALPAVTRSLHAQVEPVLWAGLRAIRLLAILSVPLATVGAILAPQLFVFLYGSGFVEAARIFRLLAFTLLPVFASAVTSSLIAGSRRPMVNAYIAGVMVLLNIGLNVLLIPRWSGMGAAAATVLTETTGLVLGTLYISRAIAPFRIGLEFVRPVLACVAVLPLVLRSPSLALLPLYAAVYLFALWLCRGLTQDDVAFIRQLLRQPTAALLLGGR